jgi:hypothetical protein
VIPYHIWYLQLTHDTLPQEAAGNQKCEQSSCLVQAASWLHLVLYSA